MLQDELAAAVDAVVLASKLCASVQESLIDEQTAIKKDRSPVTIADYGAQAITSHVLKGRFPDIPIVGEENAAALRENDEQRRMVVEQVNRYIDLAEAQVIDAIDCCSDQGGAEGRRWVLDPIDGTKGFLRKEQYAVALGLLEDGVPVLGVLGCPNLPSTAAPQNRGCLFAAAKGQGARQLDMAGGAPRPIAVSGLTDVRQAATCESVESGHSAHDHQAQVKARLGIEAEPVRIDSQCKYGAVARGEASIYLRLPTSDTYREKIWDHAAGWAVVTEAGGRVTDVRGNDLDFSLGRTLDTNRGVIATNGSLHDEVLGAVRAVLEG